MPPWTSTTDWFICPASSAKIRKRASFPASHSPSAAASAASMPTNTSRPRSIWPVRRPPTVTLADETRWRTTRMSPAGSRHSAALELLVGLDLRLVVHTWQTEAEELQELGAVAGDVGELGKVLSGDLGPDFRD